MSVSAIPVGQVLRRIGRHVRLDLGELRFQLDREGAPTDRLLETLQELEQQGLLETRLEIWLTDAGKERVA